MFFCVFHIRDRYEARACHSPKGIHEVIRHEDDPYATLHVAIVGIPREVMRAVDVFNDLPYGERYEMCKDFDKLLEWVDKNL